MESKIQDYNLQTDYINVRTSTVVRLSDHFILTAEEKSFDLKVDIIADLADIPPEYHEVFMNMLTSKFLGKVSFGSNPFSKCDPIEKIKWYQVWRWKIFSNKN